MTKEIDGTNRNMTDRLCQPSPDLTGAVAARGGAKGAAATRSQHDDGNRRRSYNPEKGALFFATY
jgi:hypothetical protein